MAQQALILLLLFALSAPKSPAADGRLASASDQGRKALVLGRGDPLRDPGGGPTHPQGAKTAFLKLVGNAQNDPARGWTCDLSWDLLERLGMNPTNTSPETLFEYIGRHHLGYRIVINNSAHGYSSPYWAVALANGMMPFAPQGNNTPGFRFEDPPGLGAAISVAGGSRVNVSSYGPGVEFIDALPLWISHANFEDAAQSWANQFTAAKFAHVLDSHPKYNIWDARQHLRQAASFWTTGWTETNGYGRVREDAVVGPLLPAPPLEFRASKTRDQHHVLFTWRNFLQSDFAATVIARKDGRIIYEGSGTNFVWTSDVEGDEGFRYWSKNQAGDQSRLESFQTRTVTGLTCGPYRTCLVLGAPKDNEALNEALARQFEQAAPGWSCDIAYRSGNTFYDKLTSFPYRSVVAVLSDFSAMVDYASSNSYRILLAPVTPAEPEMYRFKHDWDRATAAGMLVVVPHQASISKSRVAQARRLSPPRLFSALTVGEGSSKNERSFGPGLECFDAPAARGPNDPEPTQNDAAAVVAGKLARILEANPAYNVWDARQHLRQSCSYYQRGWVEDGGYGRPPAEPAKMTALDPAPPLEIQGRRADDGKSVAFSWENFLQTSFAETVIQRSDERLVYHGVGTNFLWRSDVNGDETFKFFSKDKTGRLSKSESYTVVHMQGLQAN